MWRKRIYQVYMMFHISDCKVVDLLRRRSFMYSFFCSGRLMTMMMMMMTMMTTTTMNRMSAVSCPVFLGEYSSTPHQVLVVWVFFCGSCLPGLSIRWKFSGVCEKYEGWIFVEDDRGGLVMIRRELVRTRKCSSNLLFFTLPT